MSKTAVITARVDEETLALVDRVSKAHNRSRAWFVSRAIGEAARKEAEFLAFVQEGIDAADRGERADQMLDAIRKAGDFLAGLPKAGPALEKEDARKWSVGGTNYILIYRLAGDSVQILRVHHAQEDWPKLP